MSLYSMMDGRRFPKWIRRLQLRLIIWVLKRGHHGASEMNSYRAEFFIKYKVKVDED